MDTIFVEVARKNELETIHNWGVQGVDNYYDPDALMYPTTVPFKGISKNKTILYMPVQTAVILESLAINPEASKHEITVALRQIVSQLRFDAKTKGIGEIYFLGTNDQTNEFASKHDFTELPWKIFRMKTYFEESNADKQNNPQGLQGRE